MPKQDVIVIGASAGGVEALQVLAAGLPADLAAAVFIVLHIGNGSHGHSWLAQILSKAGPLRASQAEDGEPIEPGRIYVARPNFHLMVGPGRMQVVDGPKENLARPSINPLFRSAAMAYGPRVTGVILTGMLDDGVAGLAAVKRRGGVAVVQNPDTALHPSMPENALKYVDADYVLDLKEIAATLVHLAVTERSVSREVVEPMTRSLIKVTCPECRGPLWEEREGNVVQYRCRVGHAYSPLALSEEHHATVERSIWSAIVALEEAADIAERLTPELGDRALEDARFKREQVAALKKVLQELNVAESDVAA
jgi:two-component system, chemotaxis family, protein-glutamate methylesterase/glutaminase